MSSGSFAHGFASSSSTWRRNSSMPISLMRNFTRAFIMFLRRKFGSPPSRSNTLSIASEARMYSPFSTGTKSKIVSAWRGMVERPPPTRISNPRTSRPFSRLTLAMKPRSWKGVPAQSLAQLEKAVFHLRGRRWQMGFRSMFRA